MIRTFSPSPSNCRTRRAGNRRGRPERTLTGSGPAFETRSTGSFLDSCARESRISDGSPFAAPRDPTTFPAPARRGDPTLAGLPESFSRRRECGRCLSLAGHEDHWWGWRGPARSGFAGLPAPAYESSPGSAPFGPSRGHRYPLNDRCGCRPHVGRSAWGFQSNWALRDSERSWQSLSLTPQVPSPSAGAIGISVQAVRPTRVKRQGATVPLNPAPRSRVQGRVRERHEIAGDDFAPAPGRP